MDVEVESLAFHSHFRRSHSHSQFIQLPTVILAIQTVGTVAWMLSFQTAKYKRLSMVHPHRSSVAKQFRITRTSIIPTHEMYGEISRCTDKPFRTEAGNGLRKSPQMGKAILGVRSNSGAALDCCIHFARNDMVG